MTVKKFGGIFMTYFCNKCLSPLEEESACGSVSYFCPQCKELVSRSKMLDEAAMKEVKKKK